jgi:hypothetical protein
MKTISLLTSLAVALALAGCAPKLDDARAAFCKDLGAYAKSVAAVGALGPESTVSDFTKMQKDENQAYKKLERSLSRLTSAQNAAMKRVDGTFEKVVADIKDTEKLGTASATVAQATAQALDQYSDIASTTCVYGAPEEDKK